MQNRFKALVGSVAVVGIALGAGVLATSAPMAQPLVQKSISLQQAITVVKAAIAECSKNGSVISITVVDRDGELVRPLAGAVPDEQIAALRPGVLHL